MHALHGLRTVPSGLSTYPMALHAPDMLCMHPMSHACTPMGYTHGLCTLPTGYARTPWFMHPPCTLTGYACSQ